jgi:HlyD family secretion protein
VRERPYAIVAAGLVATLALVGCHHESEPDAAPVVTVDVAPVLNAGIQRVIRADAIIYPREQAAIVPKVTAPIKAVHVEKGAIVHKGQLLIELENQDLAASTREAQAAYNLAQSEFETASRATVPEETHKAQLELQAAKDALDAQQSLYDNRVSLFREGAIAQRDVNDAQVTLSQARTQYEIAKKRLEDLQGFARDQALKGARAQLDQAQGRHDAAAAQLSYTRIVSPIDGVVTDRPGYPGETAVSGTPVVTVMNISKVIARAHISGREASELKVGNPARIIAPNGAPIEGTLTTISPAVDPQGTTVEVWVEVSNQDGKLRPGSSAKVELIAQSVPTTLVIPQSALLTTPSGSTSVIVIDPENKPHKKAVTVGIRDLGRVQITDGLENGQRVATSGAFELAKLEPEVLAKTKVQIQEPKEEEEEEEDKEP